MNSHADLTRLDREWGIVPLAQDRLLGGFRGHFALAMDAQPARVITSSGGIPAGLSGFVHPEVDVALGSEQTMTAAGGLVAGFAGITFGAVQTHVVDGHIVEAIAETI